jgi:hypothetical protein
MNQQRVQFVESLLCIDLKRVIEWNRDRDPNAKRKLIQFINLLYSRLPLGFKAALFQKGSLGRSDCFDSIGLESFDSGSSGKLSKQLTHSHSFSKWLAGPVTRRKEADTDSTTTGSFFTDFSDLSITTYSSTPQIRPVYASNFQEHKRGIPVNRRQWNPASAHTKGYTRSTSFDSSYGTVCEMQQEIHRSVLDGVFKAEVIGEVYELFKSCSSAEKQLFVDVARSLRCACANLFETTTKQSFDHARDIQIWYPAKARPFMTRAELSRSQLPFGICASARRNYSSDAFGDRYNDIAFS